MEENKYYYFGSKGQSITIDLGVDLSTVTIAKILYKKPSGEVGEWVAKADTKGTSISYTTSLNENDFDEVGIWQIQPYCKSPSWEIYGDIINMVIRDIIKEVQNEPEPEPEPE